MSKHLVQDLGHDLVDPEAGICCTKDWLWTTPSPFSTLFVAKVGQTSSQDDVTIRPGPDTIWLNIDIYTDLHNRWDQPLVVTITMFSHVFSLFLLRPAQRDIKINLHRKWQKLAAQRGNSDSCNKLCQSVLFHRIQNPTTHCIRTMVHSTMWGLKETSHNWFPLGLQRIYNRKVAQSPLAGGPPTVYHHSSHALW